MGKLLWIVVNAITTMLLAYFIFINPNYKIGFMVMLISIALTPLNLNAYKRNKEI